MEPLIGLLAIALGTLLLATLIWTISVEILEEFPDR
jgi:hypothetical protein